MKIEKVALSRRGPVVVDTKEIPDGDKIPEGWQAVTTPTQAEFEELKENK